MVKCPACRHLGMKIHKDKLVCEWCGWEQAQPKEHYESTAFKDVKEMLE